MRRDEYGELKVLRLSKITLPLLKLHQIKLCLVFNFKGPKIQSKIQKSKNPIDQGLLRPSFTKYQVSTSTNDQSIDILKNKIKNRTRRISVILHTGPIIDNPPLSIQSHLPGPDPDRSHSIGSSGRIRKPIFIAKAIFAKTSLSPTARCNSTWYEHPGSLQPHSTLTLSNPSLTA